MDSHRFKSALEAALILLGETPEGAKFRLTDILVEEVSFVDRAANKRPFLVVKRQGEEMTGSRTGPDGTPVAQPGEQSATTKTSHELILATPMKEGLLEVMTEVIERAVAVTTAIKGAQETPEDGAPRLDATVVDELGQISELLQNTLAEHPADTDKGASSSNARGILLAVLQKVNDGALEDSATRTVADGLLALLKEHVMKDKQAAQGGENPISAALKELGTLAATTSAAIESAGEVSEEAAAAIGKISETVAALTDKTTPAAPEAPAETPAEAGSADDAGGAESEPADKTTPAEPAEPAAPAEGESSDKADPSHVDLEMVSDEEFIAALDSLGDLPTEAAHKFQVLALAMQRIANAPDPVSLARIRDQMIGISKALEARAPAAPAGEPETAAPETPPEPQDVNQAILSELRNLNAAVTKLTPAAPADQTTEASAEGEAESAEKRALEGQALPPARGGGDLGNVGHGGPESDQPAGEKPGALSNVMKRLDDLQSQVREMASTPQSPASRAEPMSGEGAAPPAVTNSPQKKRWII